MPALFSVHNDLYAACLRDSDPIVCPDDARCMAAAFRRRRWRSFVMRRMRARGRTESRANGAYRDVARRHGEFCLAARTPALGRSGVQAAL